MELLVVMAIVAVLMGLVMPAVMQMRVNALRVKCINNEKNIATAIIAHEATKQSLPFLYNNQTGWTVAILEQLGEGKLAEAFLTGGSQTPLATLKCPAGDADRTGLSYSVNHGQGNLGSETEKIASGLLYAYDQDKPNQKYNLKSIKDGASNTILLMESLKSRGMNKSWWDRLNWTAPDGSDTVGFTWDKSVNDPLSKDTLDGLRKKGQYFDSQHPNVGIIAFADGSVRPINKQISYNTYKCLMAPNDNVLNLVLGDDPNLE